MSTQSNAVNAGDSRSIPLNLLVVADENVRKAEPTGIESLADNIAANGLLHNLIVYPHRKKFAVAAGSRRRAALKLLAKRKALEPDALIDCRVVSKTEALSVSLSENVAREAMHPIDELEAWDALVSAGQSVDDVAANFGVTATVVKQRLKLAGLSPRILQACRDGAARMDQLIALSVSDDHQAQETAFFEAGSHYALTPEALRATLTNDAIRSDHPLVRFVGLPTYVAAGGEVQNDLFSSDAAGESLAYCTDPDLLQELATQAMQPTIDEHLAKGWKWVEFVANLSHVVHQCDRAQPKRKRLKKEQSAQRAELSKAVDVAQDAYDDAQEADASQEAIEALGETLDAAEAAFEKYDASLLAFDPKVMALAGCAIGLDVAGNITITFGLVRDEDSRAYKTYLKALDAKKNQKPGTDEGGEESNDDAPASDGPRISKVLRARLTAHRTNALRFSVAMDPLAALRMTVATLAENAGIACELADGLGIRGPYMQESALAEPDILDSTVFKDWHRLHTGAVDSLNADGAIDAMSQDQLLAALAALVSDSINVVEREEREATAVRATALAQLVDLDMRKHWQPTAESYFQHVPIAQMTQDIAEFAPDSVSELSGLSKSALAAQAEKLVAGSGWLPELLRAKIMPKST